MNEICSDIHNPGILLKEKHETTQKRNDASTYEKEIHEREYTYEYDAHSNVTSVLEKYKSNDWSDSQSLGEFYNLYNNKYVDNRLVEVTIGSIEKNLYFYDESTDKITRIKRYYKGSILRQTEHIAFDENIVTKSVYLFNGTKNVLAYYDVIEIQNDMAISRRCLNPTGGNYRWYISLAENGYYGISILLELSGDILYEILNYIDGLKESNEYSLVVIYCYNLNEWDTDKKINEVQNFFRKKGISVAYTP